MAEDNRSVEGVVRSPLHHGSHPSAPDRCRQASVRGPLEWRSAGTNGYVSAWGALMNLCPPGNE